MEVPVEMMVSLREKQEEEMKKMVASHRAEIKVLAKKHTDQTIKLVERYSKKQDPRRKPSNT